MTFPAFPVILCITAQGLLASQGNIPHTKPSEHAATGIDVSLNESMSIKPLVGNAEASARVMDVAPTP